MLTGQNFLPLVLCTTQEAINWSVLQETCLTGFTELRANFLAQRVEMNGIPYTIWYSPSTYNFPIKNELDMFWKRKDVDTNKGLVPKTLRHYFMYPLIKSVVTVHW